MQRLGAHQLIHTLGLHSMHHCCCWLVQLVAAATHQRHLPAGLVVDACNSFKWPEDAECFVKLLSTILADTANVQVVVMLPGACTMSRSQWIVDTPPHMSRYPTPDPCKPEVHDLWWLLLVCLWQLLLACQ